MDAKETEEAIVDKPSQLVRGWKRRLHQVKLSDAKIAAHLTMENSQHNLNIDLHSETYIFTTIVTTMASDLKNQRRTGEYTSTQTFHCYPMQIDGQPSQCFLSDGPTEAASE